MWQIHQPVQIVFGEGAIKQISTILEGKNLSRSFLICDHAMVETGNAERLAQYAQEKMIGRSCEVEPDPTIQNVDVNAALVRESGADCLIAMGGGSVIDCAKAVAVAVAENVTGAQLLNRYPVQKALPIIAIPTTSGTGSEVTSAASLNDKEHNIRGGIMSPALYAATAIVDPELTWSLPAKPTAFSGLDALSHALDALSSVNLNPYSEALAIRAAQLVMENLTPAVKDKENHEARSNMALASTLAGLAFSQVGTTATHACTSALSALYPISHGEACAFTLDTWLRINSKARPALNQVAQRFGFADAAAMADRILAMKQELGCRTHLTELGGTQSDIPTLAKLSAESRNMAVNVVKATQTELEAIYLALL